MAWEPYYYEYHCCWAAAASAVYIASEQTINIQAIFFRTIFSWRLTNASGDDKKLTKSIHLNWNEMENAPVFTMHLTSLQKKLQNFAQVQSCLSESHEKKESTRQTRNERLIDTKTKTRKNEIMHSAIGFSLSYSMCVVKM